MTVLLQPPPGRGTGGSAPPRIRKNRDGRREKPERYLYVCGEDQESIAEMESMVESARSDIRSRVKFLTYTDPAEFERHAYHAITSNVSSVVAMCIRLTPDTVDRYFEIMCLLIKRILPQYSSDDEKLDARLILFTLYTFGNKGETFTLSVDNARVWNDFTYIRRQGDQISSDILTKLQAPFFSLHDQSAIDTIKGMLDIRFPQ